jgi:hypothetical protein
MLLVRNVEKRNVLSLLVPCVVRHGVLFPYTRGDGGGCEQFVGIVMFVCRVNYWFSAVPED